MKTILKRLEEALFSNDLLVRKHAIRTMDRAYIARPETLMVALKAYDQGLMVTKDSTLLPLIKFIPIDESGLVELIKRTKENVKDKLWFSLLIKNANTELLLAYEKDIRYLLEPTFIKDLHKIKSLQDEELLQAFKKLLIKMESNKYSSYDFELGKRYSKEILARKIITEEEIRNVIQLNSEDEYFSYDGIFSIYMAGELKIEAIIPLLTKLLVKNMDEDILLEEVSDALVKIGTDEVVREVAAVAEEEEYLFSVSILGKIHSEFAEEILLQMLGQTEDVTAKTAIADALCHQLSVKAIPKIEEVIHEGYDRLMLNLEESLYANIIMNEIEYSGLHELKESIQIEEDLISEGASFPIFNRNSQKPVTVIKTAERNDPCPCGSGKKYKKCCM